MLCLSGLSTNDLAHTGRGSAGRRVGHPGGRSTKSVDWTGLFQPVKLRSMDIRPPRTNSSGDRGRGRGPDTSKRWDCPRCTGAPSPSSTDPRRQASVSLLPLMRQTLQDLGGELPVLWARRIRVAAAVGSSVTLTVPGVDPMTFVAVATLLTAVGLAAGVFPARRAAKADPLVALRHL